ncbi:MAG: class I SAM-dependent methyltransferase [Rhodospirillales bacterium]|nr:class I SAM-dependent methyltransferase [Rhodospirillales bacterium]
MTCRYCGSARQLPFLDLGAAPPSNAYLTEDELRSPEVWLPLRLLVCEECWLVQTEGFTGREILFTEDYAYFSSFSDSWLAHAKNYVQAMVGRFGLNKDSLVVEVAANDGYLLQYVREAGVPCYGVEPTASTAAAAAAKGIEIVERFFGEDLADELSRERRPADLIVANNVLGHVPDINNFVGGFRRLLEHDGSVTCEFPHLLRMVQGSQFDTVYHEHYSYLSLTALMRIFSSNGLSIFDVDELVTHGGSLRVYAQRTDSGVHTLEDRVGDLLRLEREAGVAETAFYAGFQAKAEKIKDDLVAFLLNAKRQGLKVGAYGAAAKGNTLLNFAGIRPDLLRYVVDRNPAKQNKFLPGSRIPIVKEDYMKADKPEMILILPWNLQPELMTQLDYVRQWGGQFVVAVPGLEVSNDMSL